MSELRVDTIKKTDGTGLLSVPAESGTVLTSASDLPSANLTGNVASARITNALNATGSAPIYACRAWVNFDGTTNTGGNCDIRGSGNVSSVADNGTGDYDVNFTTAMPDVNYCALVATDDLGSASRVVSNVKDVTTGSARIVVNRDTVSGYNDVDRIYVAIFR